MVEGVGNGLERRPGCQARGECIVSQFDGASDASMSKWLHSALQKEEQRRVVSRRGVGEPRFGWVETKAATQGERHHPRSRWRFVACTRFFNRGRRLTRCSLARNVAGPLEGQFLPVFLGAQLTLSMSLTSLH